MKNELNNLPLHGDTVTLLSLRWKDEKTLYQKPEWHGVVRDALGAEYHINVFGEHIRILRSDWDYPDAPRRGESRDNLNVEVMLKDIGGRYRIASKAEFQPDEPVTQPVCIYDGYTPPTPLQRVRKYRSQLQAGTGGATWRFMAGALRLKDAGYEFDEVNQLAESARKALLGELYTPPVKQHNLFS